MISANSEKGQNQFPAFLSKVEAGEGKKGKRILGKERGKIWMSDDFDEPLPEEILAEFYR